MTDTSAPVLTRLRFWSFYLIISFIVAISSITSSNSNTSKTSNRNWAIACSIITFFLSLSILGTHFLTNFPLLGGKIEGLSLLMTLLCWCALVITVSQPGVGLAISAKDDSVINGNIYYFSWAGFLVCSILSGSYLQHAVGVYVPNEIKDTRFRYWCGLLASSIVVLGTSVDFLTRQCNGAGGSAYCNRCILGVTFGALGTIASLGLSLCNILLSRVPFMVESLVSVFIFALNALLVAFITSETGPGVALGNLYYFSWISFVLSLLIASGIWEDYKRAENGDEEINYGESDKQDLDLEKNDSMEGVDLEN